MDKKLTKHHIKQIIDMLERREKRRVIVNFLSNKYVLITFAIVFVFCVDNPDIVVTRFIKNLFISLFPFLSKGFPVC